MKKLPFVLLLFTVLSCNKHPKQEIIPPEVLEIDRVITRTEKISQDSVSQFIWEKEIIIHVREKIKFRKLENLKNLEIEFYTNNNIQKNIFIKADEYSYYFILLPNQEYSIVFQVVCNDLCEVSLRNFSVRDIYNHKHVFGI